MNVSMHALVAKTFAHFAHCAMEEISVMWNVDTYSKVLCYTKCFAGDARMYAHSSRL